MMMALPADSTSSSARPVQEKVMPCILFLLKRRSMAWRPWPELRPGAGEPSISAERKRL